MVRGAWSGQRANDAEQHADEQAGEAIGLRVLRTTGLSGDAAGPGSARETIEQTSTSHNKHRMHFRLFKLAGVTPGQPLLLRILHRASRAFQNRNVSEPYVVSTSSALQIAYGPPPSGAQTLVPAPELIMTQATQVEIMLDEEGIPCGYRIDGTEF